jgi:molybdate transport system substrate-binding protein
MRAVMNLRSLISATNTALLLLLTPCISVHAAEVRLLSAEVMRHPINELAAEFERTTGHKLTVVYDSAVKIGSLVGSGEPSDVTIIQKPMVETLAEHGYILPGSIVSLARSGIGAAVPKGAPKPDISSIDAVKRSLLAAKQIGYPDPKRGAASGILFQRDLERLGIADQVDAKLKAVTPSWEEFVARNGIKLVITQPMEILADPGLDLVGWLPDELQDYSAFTWTAAVTANAKEPEAGRALIRFLVSPTAAAVIKRKGMNPVAP